MGTYNFEQSNVIMMIYKQICIVVGIILLFLFGMDTARNYILPIEWVKTDGSSNSNNNNDEENENSSKD
jgi:hypothetical protein